MMRVPYTKYQLLLAASSLDDSLFDDHESIQDSLKEILGVEQPLLNLKAGEYHGISVVELINSANYETLIKSFQESLVIQAATFLEQRGLTNLEAWAVICIIFGILEI